MTTASSTVESKTLPRPGDYSGVLALDLALGRWMQRQALEGGATDEAARVLAVTAVLVSQERGRGHTCIQLPRWAGRSLMLPPGRRERFRDAAPSHEDMVPFPLPDLKSWLDVLKASPLVGRGTSPTPLVLGPRYRIYLYRYWAAEQRLGRNLRRLLEPFPGTAPPDVSPTLQGTFQHLFPPPADPGAPDHQALAASLALRRRLCLISGGPGTGKTTTVSRLLALWLHVAPNLRIGLAAPTGKAAARLVESIAQQVDGLGLSAELLERFPRQAATLHRLLGYQPRQGRFRHRAERSLPYDLLVVDEASMVDLLMMDALATALPKGGRLILIGDQDQLSSVETGFVLGDLCRGAREAGWSPEFGDYFEQLSGYGFPPSAPMDPAWLDHGPQDLTLQDTAVELQTNYRFRSQPGIGALAQSIRDQHPHRCLDVLDDPRLHDVERVVHPPNLGALLTPLRDAFQSVLQAPAPHQALQQLDAFRVLAATRRGPWGVEQLNPRIDRWLQTQGWIDDLPRPGRRRRSSLVRRASHHGDPQRLRGAALQRRRGHLYGLGRRPGRERLGRNRPDRERPAGILSRRPRGRAQPRPQQTAAPRHGLGHDGAQESRFGIRSSLAHPAGEGHAAADARTALHRRHPGPASAYRRRECRDPHPGHRSTQSSHVGPARCGAGRGF